MNQKIMAIIYSDKGNFLLLKMNPKWLKQEGWFVVTGSTDGEYFKTAVKREVKEETGLDISSIKPTNYSVEYEWPKNSGMMHHEKAFLVKVIEQPVKLSGEHLEYKWLTKDNFLKLIDWWGDKEELKNILEEAK
jgi:8-oxo-dGTP pyrophosphatase MutT (NUDIX family)